jgi:hypothetical protein
LAFSYCIERGEQEIYLIFHKAQIIHLEDIKPTYILSLYIRIEKINRGEKSLITPSASQKQSKMIRNPKARYPPKSSMPKNTPRPLGYNQEKKKS